MTQEEWQRLMISAPKLWRAGKQLEALTDLDAAATRLENERSRDAAEWEREQVLSLKASLLLEDPQRTHDAAVAYMDLATILRGQLRSYGRAVGFALAQASLCMFKEGKEVEAYQVGENALALLGLHGDGSKAFQDLIGCMRQFDQERAKKQQPSPSKRW